MRTLVTKAGLASIAFALGCAQPTVQLSIGFPSQEAFLVTTSVDVLVVPLGDNRDQCATLLGQALQGTDVHAGISSLGLTPCQVRAGASLPDPGGGAQAFIVLGRVASGPVLGGCSVGETYPGGHPIDVDVFPTGSYATALASAHIVPGTTADQRCMGSSP
jgi:hypothetical protein